MNAATRLTVSDLGSALLALRARPASPRWTEAYVGDAKIGGFGKTTYRAPDMRWRWKANGSYGECATREEAIAEIEARVPAFLESLAKEAAEDARFAAMPAHIQELQLAVDAADVERIRANSRNPFNARDFHTACDAYWAARRALAAAELVEAPARRLAVA